MIRDILIMLAAVAAVVAFAPKVSHGVNTPAQEAVDAPVTAAPPARRPEGSLTPRGADGFWRDVIGPRRQAWPRGRNQQDDARPTRPRFTATA